jgi:hypothetical protein
MGGHNENVDLNSCTSSTVNRCLRGLVRSSHATDGFPITKPIGNPADRLHQCWSALPVRTCLGLSSAFDLLLCTLRPLLWRSLAVPITPLALALLVDQLWGSLLFASLSRIGRLLDDEPLTAAPAPAVALNAADKSVAVVIDFDQRAITRRANLTKPATHPLSSHRLPSPKSWEEEKPKRSK